MQPRILSALFVLIIAGSGFAQNVVPIGQWRDHLPFRSGKFVTQSEDRVYFSTEQAIVSFDKEERSPEFLTRLDGLSNVDIALIRYNTLTDVLIIIYENTAIDLVDQDGNVSTLNQIRNFDNFLGEKAINNLYIANDSIIYLAASYGVSRLNIAAQEFDFTTFTGLPVLDVRVYEGEILAATEEGIYRFPAQGVNPDDFGNWMLLGPEEGFPSDYSASALADFDGALHVAVNDTVFRYDDMTLSFVHYEEGSTIRFFSHEGVHLLAGFRPNRVVYFHPDGSSGIIPFNCVRVPNYVVEDEQNRLWFGNDQLRSDFQVLENIDNGFCEAISFNSPWSTSTWDIAVQDGQLWLASGALNQILGASFIPDGFSSFIDGRWEVYNRENTDFLKGKDLESTDDDIQVFITVAIHPSDGTVYIGSFLEGLVELRDGEFTVYTDSNSPLQAAIGDPIRVRIGGLAFDEDNQLWMTNNTTDRPIGVLLPGGELRTFAMPGCSENTVYDIAVDGSGYKWAMLGSGSGGLLLFDEGDIDDPMDDRCRVFNANGSELPNNTVNCLAADLEGDIWAGTSEGIVIFECGPSAFDPACVGTRRIVEQDGFGAFLLETENVRSIAVDGANRKWVGTTNGIFVLSPNGEEEILRFTAANSPLFSDEIIEVEVDQSSGEVYIGTAEGLLSYQSAAVAGGRTHSSSIKVFPNPVRPEYDGPIAINGLARDANVKITDMSGQLVFETTALGGQAIWDGRNYNGRRVSSGVYLVFSTSDARFAGFSGEADAAVAKILVVN